MRKLWILLLIISLAFTASFGKTSVDKVRYKGFDVQWLKANGFWMTVNNFGQHGVDDGITQAGGYWAYQNGDAQYIYGAGMWFGAMVGVDKYVTSGYISSDGSSEYTPGEIGSSYVDAQWKVYLSNSADWPLAEIKSVLDSYAVYHDANAEPPLQSAGNTHTPLNIEVVQKTFEWNYPSNNDIIFIVYEVTNEGASALTDAYMGLVQDPDVGGAVDDMVGFDEDHNVGYCYDNDGIESYGHAGYIGYDFLDSPIDPVTTDPIGLTAFKIFSIDVAPVNDVERYNLMAGYNMAGDTYDPFDVDSGPADKRFMMTTGPFDLAAGETANVVVAVIPGYELGDSSTVSVIGDDGRSYRTLIGNSEAAQFIFDNDYLLPAAPKKPEAVVQSLDRKVFISWDSTAESYPDPYYAVASDPLSTVYDPDYIEFDFAGYRVYKAPTPAGPWEEIAEYDLSGLKHSFLDTDVINGIAAYYKVVAFDEQLNAPTTLESLGDSYFAQGRTDAVGTAPPVAPEPANGGSVVSGANPGTITAVIVEPQFVTGHTYRVQVEDGSNANRMVYSVIDLDTTEYIADHFLADNLFDPNLGGDNRYAKAYQTEVLDGVQYTIDAIALGDQYTYTYNSIATTSSNPGEYDAASNTFVGDYGWTARMGTGHDFEITFVETEPGVMEVNALDVQDTAYAGEDIYMVPLAGLTGDRYAGGFLVTHWDLFGYNWTPTFEPGLDTCIFFDGYYIVFGEAYAEEVYLDGDIVDDLIAASPITIPDEDPVTITDGYDAAAYLGMEPYFYAPRYADPGDYRLTFHTGDVYETAVSRVAGTTGSVDVMPVMDLSTASGLIEEDLVIRFMPNDNSPSIYLKDWTTGTLSASTSSVVGTVYTIDNGSGNPAYVLDISGMYGDEFEVNFTTAGVSYYCNIDKDVAAVWTPYGAYIPVSDSFELFGNNVNYVAGVEPANVEYQIEAIMNTGAVIYGDVSDGTHSVSDGDMLFYTIVTNPIVDGTELTFDQDGNIITGGEYWEVDTFALAASDSIDLSDVQVVPNPIYPINKWDQNVTSRKAEFTHLPGECDIYIYTVAGDIVNTLHHDNGTGTEEWDVRNKDNQDIASGIYIYVIYVDDDTKTEGTFAVIR